MKCKRDDCLCTHEFPCDAGWIAVKEVVEKRTKLKDGTDKIITTTYDAVKPCQICDPERHYIFKTAKNREELFRRLQERSPKRKLDAYERGEGERTRTL